MSKMSTNSPQSSSEDKKKVVFYALSMALGTLSSRVLGLVRDIAFAAFFSRAITDAWTAAFRLPNLFRRLLGEGSLSVSFIPVFVEANLDASEDGGLRARNLVNGFYSLLLLVLTVLTALGILYSESILKVLLAQDYVQSVEKFQMTVRMAKIMFGFIFLMSHFAFYMGILNALNEYSWPAMAPIFFNIAMIVSTLIPGSWFLQQGDTLAWGVVVGGILQAGVLVPQLIRRGFLPRLTWASVVRGGRDITQVLKNMAPGLLGTGLLQITTVVNLRFASSLGEGPISYIYWADRLLELPLSLVAVSLGTALLPTLSKLWSEGDSKKMLSISNYYLRLNLFVAMPAAVGLFVLSVPIVEVLFKRGRFSNADVEATALVVSIYAFILISSSTVRVLVPIYYAIKNTWWPALVSGICLLFHIMAAPYLMQHFGLKGLVFSTFLSASLNLALLSALIGKFIGSYEWGVFFKSFVKIFFCSAVMGQVIYFLNLWSLTFAIHNIYFKIINLGLIIVLGILVYGGCSWLLNSEELDTTIGSLMRKISSKFARLKARDLVK